MNQTNFKKRAISEEMQDSFLDYAMSVIVDRALPDVRDGLKPVHRRILTTLRNLGLTHTAKHRKSAKIAGDVSGNYHPHGEAIVYPSMVYLAQDWKMRYPLVDGQGNFGSIDGDPPAQMRYTEARMTKITQEMLADIDRDTVDFRDNYDGTRKEPVVLPAKIPLLLLNGALGIAVGMATNIPPHNLKEVIQAIALLIDNPEASISDLMKFIKGPDFPTGGYIFDIREIEQTYATGKGSIIIRGKAEIVETKKGNFKIIITEIPFQVSKSTLIEKIADLVHNKKLEGIRDVRDESGREDSLRIVIDLKKDAYPKKILNKLFKLASLQTTFHVNMLSLVDGIQPKVMGLKEILEEFIKHRVEVVTRRAKFDLRKAKEREHILIGLNKALDHIDAVIKTIKQSKTKEIAHKNLVKKFKLSNKQAAAILEMKLSTLAGLERKKIKDELEEKRKLIKELIALLGSKRKILDVIKKETLEIDEKYKDQRKTKVQRERVGEFIEEDLIPNEEAIISLTRGGYVKRMPTKTYKQQRRGGKGVIGMATKEEDVVDHLFWAMTHNDTLFFTNTGKVFKTKAHEIPEASRQAKGQAIVNFLQLAPEEKVTGLIHLKKNDDTKYLMMTTKRGLTKKVAIEGFQNVRRSGLIAIKLKEKDALRWVRPTKGNNEGMIVTQNGQSIRFKEQDIRSMGRNAAGVKGIRLKGDDQVIGMSTISQRDKEKNAEAQILTVSENGYGKRSDLASYKVQNRGGSGIKTAKTTSKTGKLVSMNIIDKEDMSCDLLVVSSKGQVIRTNLKDISILGRATQGVRIMKLAPGDKIAAVTII